MASNQSLNGIACVNMTPIHQIVWQWLCRSSTIRDGWACDGGFPGRLSPTGKAVQEARNRWRCRHDLVSLSGDAVKTVEISLAGRQQTARLFVRDCSMKSLRFSEADRHRRVSEQNCAGSQCADEAIGRYYVCEAEHSDGRDVNWKTIWILRHYRIGQW